LLLQLRHPSLLARLDRLGPDKEVAQIGAAIGREFSHALLASVVRNSEAELDRHWIVSFKLDCWLHQRSADCNSNN